MAERAHAGAAAFVRQRLLTPHERQRQRSGLAGGARFPWRTAVVVSGDHAVSAAVREVLDQDPYALLSLLYSQYERGLPPGDEDTAVNYYFYFFGDDVPLADLEAGVAAQGAEVERLLREEYRVEEPRLVEVRSTTSPALVFGRVVRAPVRSLIDWNKRVVVKVYRKVGAMLAQRQKPRAPAGVPEPEAEADARAIADFDASQIATDLVLGATALNALVDAFPRVATPHFAYRLDWFLAPPLALVAEQPLEPRDAEGLPRVVRLYAPAGIAQYVVEERIDVTFAALAESTADATNTRLYDTRWNLYSCRALLAQALQAHEAFWELFRGIHGDFVPVNYMVRSLEREDESPYRDALLAYERRTGRAARRRLLIPAVEHANLFGEIIDFGRAQAVVPITDRAGEARRVLFGNALVAQEGLSLDPSLRDRSHDLRRFALSLIYTGFDTQRLAAATRAYVQRHVPAAQRAMGSDAAIEQLRRHTVHALVVMANLPRAADTLLRHATSRRMSQESRDIARALVVATNPVMTPAMRARAYIETDVDRANALYEAFTLPLQGFDVDDFHEFYNDFLMDMDGEESAFFTVHGGPLDGSNARLTPGYCLEELPLFAPLFLAEEDPYPHGTIVAGVVTNEDAAALDRWDAATPVSLTRCAMCGAPARGQLVSGQTHGAHLCGRACAIAYAVS
jgi:hypothetical protein